VTTKNYSNFILKENMGADHSQSIADLLQHQTATTVGSTTIITSAEAPKPASRGDGSFKAMAAFSSRQQIINNSKRAMSPGGMPGHTRMSIRRSLSTGSATTDEWGFFEDFEPLTPNDHRSHSIDECQEEKTLVRALSLPSPVTQPPIYILESSLATQQLWYATAGKRPKQPPQEREYFEQLWRKNFELSSVQYKEFSAEVTITPTVTPSNSSSSNTSGVAFSDSLGPSNLVKSDKDKAKVKGVIREEVPYKEFNGEPASPKTPNHQTLLLTLTTLTPDLILAY
jgi:hypothetical protein